MSQQVFLVPTGTANLASVKAAFRRAGAEPVMLSQSKQIRDVRSLVLPGVGAFGAAMTSLEEQGWVGAIRERIQQGQPTFAICLGLQILAEKSEESPSSSGLSIVQGTVERFPDSLRVPQFGWSEVVAPEGSRFLRSGYAYFANSYCLRTPPKGWEVAMSQYGGSYVAAMSRGDVLACQFHPELSGPWGQELIAGWLQATQGGQ